MTLFNRSMFRGSLDLIMTVLFVFLFSKRLFADVFDYHEWVGLGIGALFLLHKVVNGRWILHVTRGLFRRETPTRLRLLWTVDLMLLIGFVFVIVSGVLISRTVAPELMPEGWTKPWWSVMHRVVSFWMLLLTAVHTGLHGPWLLGVWRQHLRPAFLDWVPVGTRRTVAVFLAFFVMFYGVNAALYTGLPGKMNHLFTGIDGFRTTPGYVAASGAWIVLTTVPAQPAARPTQPATHGTGGGGGMMSRPSWVDVLCLYGGIFAMLALATAAVDGSLTRLTRRRAV